MRTAGEDESRAERVNENRISVGPSRGRWLWLFLGAAGVLGGTGLRWRRHFGALEPVERRRALPDVELRLLDGSSWSLARHRGEVVVINYWATWCAPCQEEMPALLRAAEVYRGAPVAMIGISLDTGVEVDARVQRYVSRFGVPYAIALRPESWTAGVSDVVLPTTVLVDRHGRVARAFTGPVEAGELMRDLAALVAES